jgi:hypothetical protein
VLTNIMDCFTFVCKACGSNNVKAFYDEGWCGTDVTPGDAATVEIACQDCGSSWEDGDYTRRDKFPSAEVP